MMLTSRRFVFLCVSLITIFSLVASHYRNAAHAQLKISPERVAQSEEGAKLPEHNAKVATDHGNLTVLGHATATGPVFGVHISRVKPALRKHLQIANDFGLMVEYVEPNSAADDAKLQRFDVLYSFDGQLLVNQEQLSALVRKQQQNDQVTVVLFRQSKQMSVEVLLKEGTVIQNDSSLWKLQRLKATELINHMHKVEFQNCLACHSSKVHAPVDVKFESFVPNTHMDEAKFQNCKACHVSTE